MLPQAVSLLAIVAVILVAGTCALDLVRCGVPLGMESGEIPDRAISASSVHDPGSVGPQHGRLRHDKNGGAWCPRGMVTPEAAEFLEVGLGRLTVVTGTKTQGRFGNGQGQEYAEQFLLDYWRPGFNKWRRWQNRTGNKLLKANEDTYTVAEQRVEPLVIASKVRFIPHADHVRTVCMRVEVVGCPWQEGVLSYSMPQGERRAAEGADLSDRSYDGAEEGGWLNGGLGQLVDGHIGQDNFLTDIYGYGKGYEWVGWRNDSQGVMGRPVELVFEFDRLRNFSAMYLHTSNLLSQKVQVFSHAKVYLSVGGKVFNGEPVQYSYMPDLVMEQARNVTVKLHHRVGRFIKLQLYFANAWLLISEVSFDSVEVSGNLTEEEVENSLVSVIDHGKDDPLQRDEVHTTPSKDDRKKIVETISTGKETESRHTTDYVIASLTTSILMLLLAIAFIVYRNRRHKSQRDHSVLPSEKTEMQLRDNINANGHMYGQVSLEDPEKNALYHEPLTNINMYAYEPQNQIPLQLQSPEYTDVPHIISQEYAIPLVNPVSPPVATFTANQVPPTPIRTTQPFRNFPPPVPPPPEKHYAATEIIQPPPIPVSPPPSIPPSVGSQGASSSTTSSYGHISSCNQIETDDVQSADVPHIPREDLRFLKRLGSGSFGEIHHCELSRFPDGFNSYTCKYVAVKILRKNASEQLRDEFFEDISHLASLKNRNIAQLLGTCLSEDPYLIIIEHTDHSDLNQFLQEHIVETATPFPTNANTLSYGCLIYMATQISFGMKYLESMKIVFRDLATRNCIVGRNYSVKISDLGLGRSLYSQDYYDYKDGNESLPIRWMAWESIIFRKFSIKSDVWAFAVTLWEILTFAREQPFDEYSDEKIIENATHYYHDDKLELKLPKPFNCPKEIYDLMVECWQRKESERPNFREIHLFLQRKNLGYKQGAKRVK